MISVTDKAKERITSLRQEENHSAESNIRVSVKGGGCSGLMYDLGFDDKINPADQVFEDKGIKILVDKNPPLFVGYYPRLYRWTEWQRVSVYQSECYAHLRMW